MDERDFAELISVFLRGTESDKGAPRPDEKDAETTETAGTADEAEIRKNIIEALAEKIKESQDERAEAAAAEPQETGGPRPTGEPAPEEGLAGEEEKGPIVEQIVTREEVDQLLNKGEPADIVPLQQILHRFLELDGVIAALLVTRDGFTVDYASNVEFEFDMISAVVATGFGVLEKIGEELGRGELQVAMFEYASGPIVVSPLVHDVVLVVVSSQWTTLGRIRWEIKKQADELIANL